MPAETANGWLAAATPFRAYTLLRWVEVEAT
jgi:hypothetical protein